MLLVMVWATAKYIKGDGCFLTKPHCLLRRLGGRISPFWESQEETFRLICSDVVDVASVFVWNWLLICHVVSYHFLSSWKKKWVCWFAQCYSTPPFAALCSCVETVFVTGVGREIITLLLFKEKVGLKTTMNGGRVALISHADHKYWNRPATPTADSPRANRVLVRLGKELRLGEETTWNRWENKRQALMHHVDVPKEEPGHERKRKADTGQRRCIQSAI